MVWSVPGWIGGNMECFWVRTIDNFCGISLWMSTWRVEAVCLERRIGLMHNSSTGVHMGEPSA